MHKDRSAKLRRRTVALGSLRTQIQNWKDATTDENILGLLSNKAKKEQLGPNELQNIRKVKISRAEQEVATLESRVTYI